MTCRLFLLKMHGIDGIDSVGCEAILEFFAAEFDFLLQLQRLQTNHSRVVDTANLFPFSHLFSA